MIQPLTKTWLFLTKLWSLKNVVNPNYKYMLSKWYPPRQDWIILDTDGFVNQDSEATFFFCIPFGSLKLSVLTNLDSPHVGPTIVGEELQTPFSHFEPRTWWWESKSLIICSQWLLVAKLLVVILLKTCVSSTMTNLGHPLSTIVNLFIWKSLASPN